MDTILQGLLDLAGVSAAMVFDGGGHVVGHRAHALYDRNLCEQVCNALNKAVDSVQLQQDDWESMSAQFADGRLLLRKVAASGGRKHVLVVVADSTLNQSFATVAIRVAANKLKKVLEGGAASSLLSSAPPAPGVGPTPPPLPAGSAVRAADSRLPDPRPSDSRVHAAPPVPPPPAESSPTVASSGVAWASGSSVGLSRIAIADAPAGAFLARSAKELARHVGPMAKVYVEEAVRRVTPDAPFSLATAAKLVDDLANQIDDDEDKAKFRKALDKP